MEAFVFPAPRRRRRRRRQKRQRRLAATIAIVLLGSTVLALAGGGIAEFMARHGGLDIEGMEQRLEAFLDNLRASIAAGDGTSAGNLAANFCSISDRASRSVSELRRPTMCTIGDPGTLEITALLRGDGDLPSSGGVPPQVAGDPGASDLDGLSPSGGGIGKPGDGDRLALNAGHDGPNTAPDGDPIVAPDDTLPPIVPTSGGNKPPGGPFPGFKQTSPNPDPGQDPPGTGPSFPNNFAPFTGPSGLGGGPSKNNNDPPGNGDDPPTINTDAPTAIGEPGGIMLFALSSLALLVIRRRRL